MSLHSQMMHVRKCTGLVALHCGQRILVYDRADSYVIHGVSCEDEYLILNVHSMLILGRQWRFAHDADVRVERNRGLAIGACAELKAMDGFDVHGTMNGSPTE